MTRRIRWRTAGHSLVAIDGSSAIFYPHMLGKRLLVPIENAAVAAVVLVCHIALAAIVILGIKGIEYLLHSGPGELLILDRLPFRYLFHLIDVAIILVFGWHGLREAVQAFRGEPHA